MADLNTTILIITSSKMGKTLQSKNSFSEGSKARTGSSCILSMRAIIRYKIQRGGTQEVEKNMLYL